MHQQERNIYKKVYTKTCLRLIRTVANSPQIGYLNLRFENCFCRFSFSKFLTYLFSSTTSFVLDIFILALKESI